MAMEDLRHVLDYLNSYSSKAIHEDFDRYLGGAIQGVRINSVGSRRSKDRPEFEATRVPTTHFLLNPTYTPTLPIVRSQEAVGESEAQGESNLLSQRCREGEVGLVFGRCDEESRKEKEVILLAP